MSTLQYNDKNDETRPANDLQRAESFEDLSEEPKQSQSWSQRLQPLLARVGAANIPVLLRGETGVGKELVARQLHALSKRLDGPFVKVNCAALPSELVESELFGYEKGSFTGAYRSTPGRFEMANRGTIFLDEIGDMDLRLQAKLLQVLQDQEFHRLGASRTTRVDVRIMAASHCDFEAAIAKKQFREDLFYRLNIVNVRIPPLRERRNEILPLCEILLDKHATPDWPKLDIPPLLVRVLLDYNWPGNIRELENLIRKYLVLRSPSMLTAEIRQLTVGSQSVFVPAEESDHKANETNHGMVDLPFTPNATGFLGDFTGSLPSAQNKFNQQGLGPASLPSRGPALVSGWPVKKDAASHSALSRLDTAKKAAEVEAILDALNSAMWNRKRAASLLKIDYKALLYKMKKLGICEHRIEEVG